MYRIGLIVAWYEMSHNVRKHAFSHMRQMKTQINLRIRAVWPESMVSAWRNYASLAMIRLRECTGWSESFVGADVWTFLTLWLICLAFKLIGVEWGGVRQQLQQNKL